jgi:hypothetical protein
MTLLGFLLAFCVLCKYIVPFISFLLYLSLVLVLTLAIYVCARRHGGKGAGVEGDN